MWTPCSGGLNLEIIKQWNHDYLPWDEWEMELKSGAGASELNYLSNLFCKGCYGVQANNQAPRVMHWGV